MPRICRTALMTSKELADMGTRDHQPSPTLKEQPHLQMLKDRVAERCEPIRAVDGNLATSDEVET
jgi:hypothetical protein